MVSPRSFWSDVLPPTVNPAWMADAEFVLRHAEQRRDRAKYNTGSFTVTGAYCIRAIAEYVKPRTIIEVGTFIGASTVSMALVSSVREIYTCDISNDCLPSQGVIETFPYQSSTEMLRELVKCGVVADLCFFDGVLKDEDQDWLARLTTPNTVYAFDDYCYGPKQRITKGKPWLETMPRKGIGNVRLLQPRLPLHVLMEPIGPDPMIALLVPEARL